MNRRSSLALIAVPVLLSCRDVREPTSPVLDEGMAAPYNLIPLERNCTVDAGFADGNFIGYLQMATGETFAGEAVSQPGFEDADWVHRAPGITVESFDRAFDVTCLVNDSRQATIDGPAIFNGAQGYTYGVGVRDLAGPPVDASITLDAAVGGTVSETFPEPTSVHIPARIEVVSGAAGRGLAILRLGDMFCIYIGNGTFRSEGPSGDAYEFLRCLGGGGWSLRPGDAVEVTDVSLRVLASGASGTTVTTTLIVEGASHTELRDQYTINVWNDATQELVYSFSGNVVHGDIVIQLLSP